MTVNIPDSVLLPYQQRWIADDSDLKIAEKSRRTGITWAEAADATLAAAASKEANGTNHFYVGSNKEMAREFYRRRGHVGQSPSIKWPAVSRKRSSWTRTATRKY